VLTPFQQRIAELFFATTESAGFALAGGAALIVRGAIDRETHDLDFFANLHDVQDITSVVEATSAACARVGLTVTPIQSSSTFARLEITDPDTVESMLIDVALDAIEEPPTITVAGPTLTAKELAANKVLALYGRMEPRDFEDTWRLADRFGVEDLLRWAAEKDPGFDLAMLADSLSWLDRHPDRRFTLPPDEIAAMRSWFASVRDALSHDQPPPDTTEREK
jgi:hypothetical protein